MTLFLRILAFAGTLVALNVLAAITLLVESATGFLYGFDTIQLGYSGLFTLAFALDISLSKPVTYSLFRLELLNEAGAPAGRYRRGVRCLLFWLLLVAPSLFPFANVFEWLPIGLRERALGELGMMAVIMSAPLVTVLATGGRRGIHDLLTGVIVVRNRRGASDGFSSGDSWVGRGRLMLGALLLWSVLVYGGLLLYEWHNAVSTRVEAYFGEHASYFQFLPRDTDKLGDVSGDLYLIEAAKDHYYDDHTGVRLDGQTERFRFRTTQRVVGDDELRSEAAFNTAAQLVPVITPGTKWVAFSLHNLSFFGPFVLDTWYVFLLDVQGARLLYAPVNQILKSDSSLTDQEGGDSVWVVTEYAPERRLNWNIMTVSWRFPTLSFRISPPQRPSDKFVGRR